MNHVKQPLVSFEIFKLWKSGMHKSLFPALIRQLLVLKINKITPMMIRPNMCGQSVIYNEDPTPDSILYHSNLSHSSLWKSLSTSKK